MENPSRSLPLSWISKPSKPLKKKPKGTGRKKIQMKKIENNSSRKVTFSKRRKGMFKKAGELCRLCDAEIAIISFSPKGRLYSFGYPSLDYVIDKFLSGNNNGIDSSFNDNDNRDGVLESLIQEDNRGGVLESLIQEDNIEKEGFGGKIR